MHYSSSLFYLLIVIFMSANLTLFSSSHAAQKAEGEWR